MHCVLQALSNRARKAKAARKPNASDCRTDTVLENLAQTRRLAETALGTSSLAAPTSSGLEEERPTNTGSGSQVSTGHRRGMRSDRIRAISDDHQGEEIDRDQSRP